MMEPDAELDELARQVVDAALEVHRALGPGFLEAVYEKALAVELRLRGIPFQQQVTIDLAYKGLPVGRPELDLLVGNRLIVELKACDAHPIHLAQVISYLAATRLTLGLLINFNVTKLRDGIRRVIRTL